MIYIKLLTLVIQIGFAVAVLSLHIVLLEMAYFTDLLNRLVGDHQFLAISGDVWHLLLLLRLIVYERSFHVVLVALLH